MKMIKRKNNKRQKKVQDFTYYLETNQLEKKIDQLKKKLIFIVFQKIIKNF